MTTETVYHQAITLLQEDLNWRGICFQLAAKHPYIFLGCYNDVHADEIKKKIIGVLNGNKNNKIPAIKVYRELNPCDLKEGLNYVNKLIEELNIH